MTLRISRAGPSAKRRFAWNRYDGCVPAEALLRSEWDRVVAAFVEFFDGLGDVTVTGDELTFDAGETGLSLAANGTSRSFMPLHDLGATWDGATFDRESRQVVLTADGMEYIYRVPPRLHR